MENKIKITASSAEQFQKIEEVINSLPSEIRNQIEHAENNFVLEFKIKDQMKNPQIIYIPRNTMNLSHKDHTVIVHAPSYILKYTEQYPNKKGLTHPIEIRIVD